MTTRFRPALESLDARVVPAAYFWTGAVSTDATNILNWSDGARIPPELPNADDDVYIGAGWTDPVTGYSRDCSGLVSDGAATSFLSLHILTPYNGTVSLGEALSVDVYEQTAAALSQADNTRDLTVNENFSWSGGVLNNTPSNANVNINGGGSISVPTGSSLSTGSRLTFGTSDGQQKETVLTGSGDLFLNGTEPEGMRVGAKATVHRVGASGDVLKQWGFKSITLAETTSYLIFSGAVADEYQLQVSNNRGLFKLEGQAVVTLKGGNDFAADYTQGSSSDARFHIMNGSTLKTPHGTQITGGSIYVMMNPDLAKQSQFATLEGKMTWTQGDLLFSAPQMIGGELVYGEFRVKGDVDWSGGRYMPSVDCSPGGVQNHVANLWRVDGTLTVTVNAVGVKPEIVPVPQQVPAGQPVPAGTWQVIDVTTEIKTPNGNPLLPDGWQLLSNPEATKKKWFVNH